MKILVTGKKGQLGSEIQALASSYLNFEFIYTDVDELDITDASLVQTYFSNQSLDLVINCAAYTAVDKAEDESILANEVNNIGVKNLVDACLLYDLKIIHVSTDYVYDGSNYKPYVETDSANPKSVYGLTKYKGELQVLNSKVKGLIIRTSWVYSAFGNNFVKTMIRLGKEHTSLNVVSDQIGTPTYAGDLAKVCLDIANQYKNWSSKSEVYHYSNQGVCSWYDFATSIMKLNGLNCKIHPIESKDYPTKAKRPYYSVLNKAKIMKQFKIEMPHWEESLKMFCDRL